MHTRISGRFACLRPADPAHVGGLAQVLPGVQTMVICTGTEMITITIGADGEPVEIIDEDPHSCVMTKGILAEATDLPLWQQLALDHAHRFAVLENAHRRDDHLMQARPTRGPPVLI